MPVTRYARDTATLTHQTAGGAGRSSYVDGDDDSLIQLGTVRDLVVNTRAVIELDAFAAVTGEMAPTAGDRFKYAGMELDATTGLHYDRARWYDPNGGRLLGQEPLGFAGGDDNLYRYVRNDSVATTDPSGLFGERRVKMGRTSDGGPTNPGYSGNPDGSPVLGPPWFGGRTFRSPEPIMIDVPPFMGIGGGKIASYPPDDGTQLADSLCECITGTPLFPRINGVPFNPMMMGGVRNYPKSPARGVDITPNRGARPGKPMSLYDAIVEVQGGGDILADSQDTARKIAEAAGDGPPIWDPPHAPGQKPHYHPTIGGSRAPGHVLY